MNEMIYRIFVEKKAGFDIEAKNLFRDIRENLEISNLTDIRVLNRYDLSGVDSEKITDIVRLILSEPQVDQVYRESLEIQDGEIFFAVEYLPGQYDQRADSAAQCIHILLKQKPLVSAAKVYILTGSPTQSELEAIKSYLINTVDSREAALTKPDSLVTPHSPPADVATLDGFIDRDSESLDLLLDEMGLAMSRDDIRFCQQYFRDTEKRDPTITEIRLLDTYWSDHCRHTTFETVIDHVDIEKADSTEAIQKAYQHYLESKSYVYGDDTRATTLMNIATLSMKEMRKRGMLDDLEISGEINACSIEREVIIDGKAEKWLIMFKNETHNHPTEIEPFGGAATCLGGAIRDPLSGRSYVYQAMRVTGSGDPRAKISETLEGKLPQKKITREAAQGYSSYGNQIGLATGLVSEVYDEGYLAKRMEVGAVIGAAPKAHVRREEPLPGDVILMVGGKTGRDGIGGATGSSKEHTEESIKEAGAEVQKGNPPEERKLQRLFRNPEVTSLIKKSNDFGAGGVSVAIGELAEGLLIDLDQVPKKYEGLDGTELAISESQERMAVVLDPKDAETFIALSAEENLTAVKIADVTDSHRLTMTWRGQTIVDIGRDFLNSNGVKQHSRVRVTAPESAVYFSANREYKTSDLNKSWTENLEKLSAAGQRGLVEQFDSSIGAATVLMPFGGKYQATPTETMAAKIPTLTGHSETCSLMSYGFNPKIAKWSPFHGAVYAVLDSVAKIVAAGGNHETVRTSLQEYFEKLGTDESRWGKPFSALLGAHFALTNLGIAAIGGKDSMSGSFKDLDVPPTLISFAVDTASVLDVLSPELKHKKSKLVLFKAPRDKQEMPDFNTIKTAYGEIRSAAKAGHILSAHTVGEGGISLALSKMAFGNRIGIEIESNLPVASLFSADHGSIILEVSEKSDPDTVFKHPAFRIIGKTHEEETIVYQGIRLSIPELNKTWEAPLERVFPTQTNANESIVSAELFNADSIQSASQKIAKPRIIIPVFPGSNCEYDTMAAFNRAGAIAETIVFRNRHTEDINESLKILKKKIDNAQIIAIPGGFSAGDEPDGSAKFIATVFRNPQVKDSVMNLMQNRDGLMIGFCNGFQALVKLGLVPYGEIRVPEPDAPTLAMNEIGRHISMIARTKVVSNRSPWFSQVRPGDVFSIPLSHGEGRFIADQKLINELQANGQVATQYVDLDDNPTMAIKYNPNGSYNAIEGITSPDGRILGRMGHPERAVPDILKNIDGNTDQKIFESGVAYFS